MSGMTLIVKTITRITVGLIFLFGLYIVLHGHLTPGGGFAGGVIIALCFVLLTLAYGKEDTQKKLSEIRTSILESVGAVFFLAIAVLGFTLGIFFKNFLPLGCPLKILSAGIIPLCNIAIMFKVGAGLFGIFIALIALRIIIKEDEKEEVK